ncbi:MAG TPA: septal ring lytic transglycosylase RlpA family protein [Polyangiales bacterium]|nr:septal ring lytic transglycosylase RlpA family protein [Polyangiales bacterium]
MLYGGACCGEAKQRGIVNNANSHETHHASVNDDHEEEELGRDRDVLRGEASYYADFFAGRKTASGEKYDPDEYTAANRTLPLGTKVRIRRVDNGRTVVVRVNDRGPFGKRRRIFDLSKAAAKKLDMLHAGRADIEAIVLD